MKKLIANYPLLLLILLALLARIYICFGTGLAWYSADSLNYIHQSHALLNGDYIYYFPNGYPLLISFFILISSIVPLNISLIVLNILLSTAGILLIYKISEKYLTGSKFLPLIAAAIAAFYPNQLNYVRLILTEVPAAFFLILSLYLFIAGKKKSSAISIGFAGVIRTTLLPIPILFAIYLLIKKRKEEALQYFIFSIIPLTLFLLYGFYKTGNFTLYIDVPKVFSISLGLNEVPADWWSGLKNYFEYMITHPLEFIYDRLRSLWDMWGFLPQSSEGLRANILFRILLALRFPLIVLAVYEFIKSRKEEAAVYLVMPAVVITFIHAIVITSVHEAYIVNPRYIFPAEPFLIILSMFALNNYLKKKKNYSL